VTAAPRRETGRRQPAHAPTRRRLLSLLRSPVGLRQVIVAKEVLDPPVALRGRRRGRR
jgi:hypothetical protein